MFRKINFYFLLLILGLSSCSTVLKSPTVEGQYSDEKAIEAYGRVLEKFVNEKGQVDFEGIRSSPNDLNIYVDYIARKKWSELKIGPQALSHHLNAYNAMSMYTVIQKGIPKTNAGFNKVSFFYLTKMNIGGSNISLVDYETKTIRAIGEDRVHWSLNCMSISCPRLPRKPFTEAHLEEELQQNAEEFFNSEQNVQVDNQNKIIKVSEILDFFPEDFVPAKAQNIQAYINHFRQTPVPLDYKVKFIPYDWTINNSNSH